MGGLRSKKPGAVADDFRSLNSGAGATYEGGGANMSEDDGGGNPSYMAYEYQIEVSAWIAVDLLLARRLCDQIAIEAKTKEDVEADIAQQFPITGLDAGTLLTIQIKTKSTGAWSSAAFAKVLRGELSRGDDATVPAKGPPPRIRPLEMLRNEAQRTYLFITDAAVDKALFPFRVESLGDPSEAIALPSKSGNVLDDDEDAETIAPRISVMESVSRELVRFRLENLLRSHGHVPEQFIAICITALVEQIRDRMLARTEGVLSRAQLVELLAKHGGSVHAARSLDRFVEPKSLRRIERLLNSQHAVIITGPSGTGKTMTADYLEASLLKKRGYEVIGAEDGPEEVRHALRSPGVYLFHLKDPFGKTRYLQAARPWASELLKLLSEAGPDKKFLITTRSDVIHESRIGTTELDRKQLERYSVSLEATDYSEAARARIYDNHVSRLKGQNRRFAVASRKLALSQLLRPLEIDRFVLAVELSDGNRNLDKLIAESQVDAIARNVCDQITDSEDKEKAIASAAVLWALIAGNGAASRELLRPIRRALRDRNVKVDLDTFSELMVLGNNLRDRRDHLTFPHPQIAKGFALAMEADESVTEEALTALIDTLVSMDNGRGGPNDWGAETVNKFRRQLIDDELQIEPSITRHVEQLLDTQLEKALTSEEAGRFSNRLRNVALLGSDTALSARFARSLTHEQKPGRKSKAKGHWGYFWSLSDEDAAMAPSFAAHDLCRFIARRFVNEVLLETAISYRSGLSAYLHSVDPTLATDAFNVVRERVSNGFKTVNNLGAAVWLALSSEKPPVDELIRFFLEVARKRGSERDSEQVRQALQNVLDEGFSEFVLDRVRDELYVPSEGLQATIKWLRKHKAATLITHPLRLEFLDEWMSVCEDAAKGISPAEIDALFELSVEEDSRASLWRIIGKSGHSAYVDRLLVEIALDWRAGRDLREARIVALSSLTTDFATRVLTSGSGNSLSCLLTILFDYSNVQIAFDNDEKATREVNIAALCEGLPADFPVLLSLLEKGDKVVRRGHPLSDEDTIDGTINLTSTQFVEGLPEDLQIALIVANHKVADLVGIACRLMGSKHAHIAAAAVKVISKVSGENASVEARFWTGLENQDYRVREAALSALVPRVEVNDRARLVKVAAEDESATVRLSFATAMQDAKWPEAIEALTALLNDERDFDPYPSYEERQTSFDVARAAAIALGAFPSLPEGALAALILKASVESDDSKLGPALMDVMRAHTNSKIDDWLLRACDGEVPGLNPESAYWELVARAGEGTLPSDERFGTRLTAGSTSMREEIDIPAVIAIALQSELALAESSWLSLGPNLSKLKSVMVLAAISHGKPDLKSWIVSRLNPSLPQDRIALILERAANGEEGDFELDEAAVEWLHSLDQDVPVDRRLRMFLEKFYEVDNLNASELDSEIANDEDGKVTD